jgi:hypothetical protein
MKFGDYEKLTLFEFANFYFPKSDNSVQEILFYQTNIQITQDYIIAPLSLL